MSFSADEMLLRYVNLSTCFREPWTAIDWYSIIWTPDLLDKIKYFFPSSGRVNSTICTHHTDADKAYEKKASRELHKNAKSYIEQILAATFLKTVAKTIQIRRTRYARHCWRSKDKLISNDHLWTLSH